jgi:hypothetical protein
MVEAPSRPVSREARDDRVTPFAVEALDLRGRLFRLGKKEKIYNKKKKIKK